MDKNTQQAAGGGLSIGCIIAAILSWSLNHSVGWAILHGILGWWYIVYYFLFLR